MAPGTFFVSISPLFLDPSGAGPGPGGGVWGAGGVRGGTWKFPKLGPTHRWLSVGGGGVRTYVCYEHMYVCTFFWHKIKFQCRSTHGSMTQILV